MSETDVMGDLYYMDGQDPVFGYSYRISLVVMEEEPVESNDDLNVELSIYDLLSNDEGSNAVVYDMNLSGAMSPSSEDFLRRRLGGESGLPAMALNDTIDVIYLVYGTQPYTKANVRVEIYEGDLDEDFDVNNEYELSEEDFVKTSTRASRKAVDALEKVTFGQSVDVRETNCAVCLEEFSIGSEVTKMPCSHVFHGECIVKWLERRFVCPICRFALPADLIVIREETTTDI